MWFLFFHISLITKKDYLIKIFEKIEPYRPIVSGFSALLQSPLCTEDDINNMFDLFEQHINSIQDQELKAKAQKILAYMKNLQEKEHISQEQDEKDIEELLASLTHT